MNCVYCVFLLIFRLYLRTKLLRVHLYVHSCTNLYIYIFVAGNEIEMIKEKKMYIMFIFKDVKCLFAVHYADIMYS